ncbi:MAG: NAD-binding protein [Peptostreptococcaceae bacterium]|nr:NAD-binding protein [Peptostreptococcaceae bacterium]
MKEKENESRINELKNHYIVCGAGEVGLTVINCFRYSSVEIVVVEENEKRVEELYKLGILAVI